jgi:hypothetical protein
MNVDECICCLAPQIPAASNTNVQANCLLPCITAPGLPNAKSVTASVIDMRSSGSGARDAFPKLYGQGTGCITGNAVGIGSSVTIEYEASE